MVKVARYPVEDRIKRTFRHTKTKNDVPPIKKLPEPLWDNHKLVVKSEITLSPRLHKFYRWNTKFKKKITLSRYKAFMKRFLRRMMEKLLFNQAGVFIENFGYFFMHLRPVPRKHRKRKPSVFNRNEIYLPMFMPIRKDGVLHQWTMDRMFTQGFRARLNRRVNTEKVDYRSALTNLIAFYAEGKTVIPNIKKKNFEHT